MEFINGLNIKYNFNYTYSKILMCKIVKTQKLMWQNIMR